MAQTSPPALDPTPLGESIHAMTSKFVTVVQRVVAPVVSLLLSSRWCDRCRLGGSVYYRCVCGRDIPSRKDQG